MTSKSRSAWIVPFAGTPITWASKMQTITALSTTEAEYIVLSTCLREVIPLMGILKEARENGLNIKYIPPKVHCTVVEDNSGALELAHLPKMRPCTKHINQSFHHFPEHIERQEIIVNAMSTDKQMADILTKPLPEAGFCQAPPLHHGVVVMDSCGGWKGVLISLQNQNSEGGGRYAILSMSPPTTNTGPSPTTKGDNVQMSPSTFPLL